MQDQRLLNDPQSRQNIRSLIRPVRSIKGYTAGNNRPSVNKRRGDKKMRPGLMIINRISDFVFYLLSCYI